MLQDTVSIKDVIVSLPPDVQALVLLYNGLDKNATCKFFLYIFFCVKNSHNFPLSLCV